MFWLTQPKTIAVTCGQTALKVSSVNSESMSS